MRILFRQPSQTSPKRIHEKSKETSRKTQNHVVECPKNRPRERGYKHYRQKPRFESRDKSSKWQSRMERFVSARNVRQGRKTWLMMIGERRCDWLSTRETMTSVLFLAQMTKWRHVAADVMPQAATGLHWTAYSLTIPLAHCARAKNHNLNRHEISW